MPWLLYRYILMDLLRIVGLTAAVLVTVIAFGATIKPLSNDALLDAGQTAKYLFLAIVPMLQFALPFAAGFGATQALHRMTTDNEIQAMAASGISYRRILLPVVGMGIALTLIMVVLTQSVIPRFVSMIGQMLATDVPKMLQASIRNGEPFERNNLQIYAEYLIAQDWPDGPDGPRSRMTLFKVAAASLDKQGRSETEVTANRAVADVYPQKGRTLVKLVMRDAVAFKPDSGQLGGSAEVRRSIIIEDSLQDNPNTMTRDQLLWLRQNADSFGQVIEARELLIQGIRETLSRNTIDDSLRHGGRVELWGQAIGDGGERRGYVVAAHRVKDGQFVTRDDSRIEIVQFDGAAEMRRFVAETARLTPSSTADLQGVPAFELELTNVEVTDLRPGGSSGAVNQRAHLTIPTLTVAGQQDEVLSSLSSTQLMARAASMRDGPEKLGHRIERVKHEIQSLQREITSRLMYRYALSVTAFLLLLLGSTLALWLRGSLPLTTYAWAFIPSILDLILVSTGEQLLREGQMAGHLIMWSGNAIMLIVILFAYFRVARH